MKGKPNKGMPRFVRRVAVSGVMATAMSWVTAATAHAGRIDNHNETLVGANASDGD